MKTQLERDFEAALASMESLSDEELASELRDYRQKYSESAKRHPRLGEMAYVFEKRPLALSSTAAAASTTLSLSKILSGAVLAAGAAFVAHQIALKIGEGRSTSNKYVPEDEPLLEAVPEEKSVLVYQPDFGLVA